MSSHTEREAGSSGPKQPPGELAARTLAMPADTNPSGDMFGGWIMSLMDAAGAITATRRAVVCCYTDIRRIGRSSITLDVEVWVLRQGCGPRIKVTAAEFTYVALDESGRPRQVGEPENSPGSETPAPAGL
jgi:acyl-CoA thioesterase YciA